MSDIISIQKTRFKVEVSEAGNRVKIGLPDSFKAQKALLKRFASNLCY